MFKKSIAGLLTVLLLMGSSANVFASEKPLNINGSQLDISASQKIQKSYVDSQGTHYEMVPLSEKDQIKEIKSYIAKKYHLKSANNIVIESSIVPNVVNQDKLGSATEVVDLGEVDGQDCPVTFENGGYIYWEDGGATTDVSFSIGGELFSMGVSIGYKASGVTGYAMYCRPGEETLMGLKRTVKFTRWHVHGWDEVSNTNIDDYVNTQQTTHMLFYNCA